MENIQQRRQIASDSIDGGIDWIDSTTGYCKCPGKHLHTTKAGRKDCRVSVDGAPTIYCVHDSCSEVIAEKNRELRSKIGAAEPIGGQRIRRISSPEEALLHSLRRRARDLKARLFVPDSPYARSYDFLIGSSHPERAPEEQAYLLFTLFKHDDIVWSGEKYDSGYKKHADRFRSVGEWQNEAASLLRFLNNCPPYGPFVTPSAFKLGSVSRSKENVLQPRFLVVESDVLDNEYFCRVVRWVKEEVELPLRTVISTGGKSLHAWFDHPEPELYRQLRAILPVLGCDEKMFNPAQPCRMPGVLRPETGRMQEMLYFNKNGQI